MHTQFYFEYVKGRDHLRNLVVNARILEWILNKERCEDVEWIRLAQYSIKWQPLVMTVSGFMKGS
jgi:hypothetical protein